MCNLEEQLEAWIQDPHIKDGECPCSVCALALRITTAALGPLAPLARWQLDEIADDEDEPDTVGDAGRGESASGQTAGAG